MSEPIIIIGAGLAGLSAALEFEAAGESCVLLEAANHIGGKLETSIVEDAYRLDRGFQVLLPSYPEVRRLEGLEPELDLRYFHSGARLELESGAVLMANPLKHPQHFFKTAFGGYGSFKDKFLVLKLQRELSQAVDPTELLKNGKGSTITYLRRYGFSESMIANFWAPFFSGVFLEAELETASGFFRYLTRMFASSPVAVPRLGIGEFPKWLAKKLTKTEIRLETAAEAVRDNVVELRNGQKIKGRAVVSSSMGFTNSVDQGPFGRVTSYWFKAPTPPFEGPWLSLVPFAATGQVRPTRLMNHLAVLSNVSPDYAPKGDALICANVIGSRTSGDLNHLLQEAENLYGSTVKSWSLLRVDELTRPLPLYINRLDDETPSQQGALARGRRAAQDVLKRL